MADDEFKEYLLKEYEEVADAHFKTLESISAFFKNYIVIMSLPAAVFSFFFQKEQFSPFNNLLIALAFLSFSIIGVGVCLYVVNLRFDSILYARTVNGIRRYFYNNSILDDVAKLRIRTLPSSTLVPSYHDWSNFYPVLLVFSMFNGIYASVGTIFASSFILDVHKKEGLSELVNGIFFTPITVFIIVALAHFLVFKELAWYREFGYLKSNIIGIDVDGVLNLHREHFCHILRRKGITLSPDDITHIPVHEIPNLSPPVSRAKEIEVFNSASYWTDMPPGVDCSDNVRKLVNSLGYKVYIFTYRPWPDFTNLSPTQRDAVVDDWRQKLRQLIETIPSRWSRYRESACYYLYYRYTYSAIVNQATRIWLKKFGFVFHKLIIEKGNENLLSKKTRICNRLAFSGKKRIKFFVEDDIEKAIKLSYLCDLVYLIDHPYNQSTQDPIPSNIIRVSGWNDIFRHIRKAN